MTELAGRLVTIKVGGDPLDLSGEELEQVSTYQWQIENEHKRVIDTAVKPELEIDDGGGYEDVGYESVSYLNGTFTFAEDHTGDDIRIKTTNPTAKYLPMSTACYAHNYTYNRAAELQDVTAFKQEASRIEEAEAGTTETNIEITGHGMEVGNKIVNTDRGDAERTITEVVDDDNFTVDTVADQAPGDDIELHYCEEATHHKRIAGQKFASGTISQWDVVDSYFRDALTDGSPVVLEFRGQDTGDPQRLWALLESAEMTAAIDSPQDEAVSFISTDELLNLS